MLAWIRPGYYRTFMNKGFGLHKNSANDGALQLPVL
jgi:hypothetical protein